MERRRGEWGRGGGHAWAPGRPRGRNGEQEETGKKVGKGGVGRQRGVRGFGVSRVGAVRGGLRAPGGGGDGHGGAGGSPATRGHRGAPEGRAWVKPPSSPTWELCEARPRLAAASSACKSFAFTIPSSGPLSHELYMFGAAGGHKARPVSGAGMPAWQAGCEEEAGDTLPRSPPGRAGRQGGGTVLWGQGRDLLQPPQPGWFLSGAGRDGSEWGPHPAHPAPLPPSRRTRGPTGPPPPFHVRSGPRRGHLCLTPASGDGRSRSIRTLLWVLLGLVTPWALHPRPGPRSQVSRLQCAVRSYCQLLSARCPPHLAASPALLLLPKRGSRVSWALLLAWRIGRSCAGSALCLLSVSQFHSFHPRGTLHCPWSLPLAHTLLEAPHGNLPRAPRLPGWSPKAQIPPNPSTQDGGDGHPDARSPSCTGCKSLRFPS